MLMRCLRHFPAKTPVLPPAERALDQGGRQLAKLGQTGTVHVVGPDRHTEFTFARLAAHVLGADTDLVVGRPAADLGDDSPRPGRVWLDRFKLRTLLGPQP